jgi:hypothetical protein
MSDTPNLDLNGFVTQLQGQRVQLADELTALVAQRASVNEKIKAKRAEQAGVERLWRATQPRASKKA